MVANPINSSIKAAESSTVFNSSLSVAERPSSFDHLDIYYQLLIFPLPNPLYEAYPIRCHPRREVGYCPPFVLHLPIMLSLESMPHEIRDMIYQFCLCGEEVLVPYPRIDDDIYSLRAVKPTVTLLTLNKNPGRSTAYPVQPKHMEVYRRRRRRCFARIWCYFGYCFGSR